MREGLNRGIFPEAGQLLQPPILSFWLELSEVIHFLKPFPILDNSLELIPSYPFL